MKFRLIPFALLLLYACESQVEQSNERLKVSILEIGNKIKENYSQYQSDITDSGYLTLLSLERLNLDKKHIESKKIIQNTESILKMFTKNNQALVMKLKNSLDSMLPSKKDSAKQIEQFKIIFDEAIEVTKSNFKTDSTTLSISKKIIKLIDEDCNYEIQDNQIRFYDETCIMIYNTYNAELEFAISQAKNEVLKRKIKN